MSCIVSSTPSANSTKSTDFTFDDTRLLGKNVWNFIASHPVVMAASINSFPNFKSPL